MPRAFGRVVSSLAFARQNRVTGAGRNARSLRLVPLRDSGTPAIRYAAQRLSRLCVLMNSILPGLRSIRDLAGVNDFKSILL